MVILKLYALYAFLIPVTCSVFIDMVWLPQATKDMLALGAGISSGLIGTGLHFKSKGI